MTFQTMHKQRLKNA